MGYFVDDSQRGVHAAVQTLRDVPQQAPPALLFPSSQALGRGSRRRGSLHAVADHPVDDGWCRTIAQHGTRVHGDQCEAQTGDSRLAQARPTPTRGLRSHGQGMRACVFFTNPHPPAPPHARVRAEARDSRIVVACCDTTHQARSVFLSFFYFFGGAPSQGLV